MTRLFALPLVVLVLYTASAPALAAPKKTLSDAELTARVESELEEEDLLSIDVSVKSGVVTLTGTAPSAWAARRAAEVAERVRGVSSVVSQVKVAAAESDSALAQAVADKIGNSLFYSIF